MENLLQIFTPVAEVINLIGISILVFGFTKELFKYLYVEVKDGIMHTPLKAIQKIRRQIGVYILLALDFLIASDIILSIVDLSMDELIRLAVTIAIRIAISYFLGKEINELPPIEYNEKT